MNSNIIILIIGVVVAIAVFLFGQGILRKSKGTEVSQDKEVSEEKKQMFCGIEQIKLSIPSSLLDKMKSISQYGQTLWFFNIFVKNDSSSVCMNPVITIKLWAHIFGFVVNDTNEDKIEVENSITIPEWGVLNLKPKRIGPYSFIDITVSADSVAILSEKTVSFSSDGDFELKTKFIYIRSGEERFSENIEEDLL